MHILMIRFSSLGDVVLQTSLISWIKYIYPNSHLSFVTLEPFKSLIDGHPDIDSLYTYKKKKGIDDFFSLRELSKEIKSDKKIDFIIDLHGTLRANILKIFFYSTPIIKIDKRSFLRFLLVKFKLNYLEYLESHHFRMIKDFSFLFHKDFDEDEYLSYCEKRVENRKLNLTSSPVAFRDIPQEKLIVISPVASFSSKRWPMENVRSLLKMILANEIYKDFKIAIIAGPEDKYCTEIFDLLPLGVVIAKKVFCVHGGLSPSVA